MKELVDYLYEMESVSDISRHHPEESVLSHSLQAMKMARKEGRGDKELIVAAAFHDVGKSIKSFGHEKIGLDILCWFGYYNGSVYELINNHMRAHWYLDGTIKRRGKVHKFLDSPTFFQSIQLARFDTVGRLPDKRITDERDYLINLLNETNRYRGLN